MPLEKEFSMVIRGRVLDHWRYTGKKLPSTLIEVGNNGHQSYRVSITETPPDLWFPVNTIVEVLMRDHHAPELLGLSSMQDRTMYL